MRPLAKFPAFLFPAFLFPALLLPGCLDMLAGGTGTGNPPMAEVSLSVRATAASPLAKAGASLPALAVRDTAGTLVTLTSIQVRVEQIDFELPLDKSCGEVRGAACEDSDIVIPRRFLMDLMGGGIHPVLAPFKLPAWTYRDIGLEPAGAEAGPGRPGDSANFMLKGILGSGTAAGKRFMIELDLTDGLDFSNPIGISLRPGSLNNLALTLKVDRWFAGVDLAKCLESGEAVPDSLGSLGLRGDFFCGGSGRNIAGKVTSSGEFDEDGDGVGDGDE